LDPAEFVKAVIEADDTLQLVVAGPGAGKTDLFKRLLTERVGDNLALTFINSLVEDLAKALEGLASVNTFHGYAKHLLHQFAVRGLSHAFNYYPLSAEVLWQETGWLLGHDVGKEDLARAFHDLDDSGQVLGEYLRAASYYNVVGHDDAVYRVVTHLDDHPESVPAKNQVVVDEIQDFNALEMALIRHLALKNRVLAAGDDDQALYAFKHATPQHIRDLPNNGYALFELPYCFRCTEVVVQAIHDVIERATASGLLVGRVPKKFWPHSTKVADGAAHPKIKAVMCSVDLTKAPYPALYVLDEIKAITGADIQAAREGGYPTAMVIGRRHFIERVEQVLLPHFPNNIISRKPVADFHPLLDGYELITKEAQSRLGWRLVTYVDPPPGVDILVRAAIIADRNLNEYLEGEYIERHIAQVETVRSLIEHEDVDAEELVHLLVQLAMTEEAVKIALGLLPAPVAPEPDPELPTITLTTFMGAKGLSAAHVFAVGLIDGHFPRNPKKVTDTEVCEFIVALSRTRKQCHLITTKLYAGEWVAPSTFFTFISKERLECLEVNKEYFLKAKPS
jgi:superfamily I DNA/RNA helicase